MSDIFISYKREEQEVAKQLADALERHGWSVWWDPKLRAGEHFDDVIEEALLESRCVIVLWSKLSVKSRFVKNEATYALDLDKLVPILIENTGLPLSFRQLQTPRLIGWDGSDDDADYLSLVDDITTKVGESTKGIADVFSWSYKTHSGELWSLYPDKEKAPQPPSMAPGEVFRDKLNDDGVGPEMVVIPAGKFWMGSDKGKFWMGSDNRDERPRHEVVIAKPFALGRYEVTFEEYDRFVFVSKTGRVLPNDGGWGRERRPVISVSWDDAKAYTKWLSDRTGKEYRLPTEAEWEYAARAGTTTKYWWGDEEGGENANCIGCIGRWNVKKRLMDRTVPVDSFKPNPFGLYDTAGNVCEWVEDCWHDSYKGAPTDGSARGSKGGNCDRRVLRGGSWDSGLYGLRSASRNWDGPADRNYLNGFRLARTL